MQLNYDAACAKFAEAARLDPDNVWLWIELGDLWVTRGSLAEAAKAFFAARDAAVRSGADRDLSVTYNRLGDVQVAQGDLAARSPPIATASRSPTAWRNPIRATRDGSATSRCPQVLPRQPRDRRPPGAIRSRNAGLGSAISRCRTARSATCRSRRATSPARCTSYRDSLAIADRLAQSDPGNAGWRRDLSVSYNKVGDVQVAQGDLAGALTSYRDSLAIRDRLAQSDSGNAGWRRDLSVSHNKVGNVQVAQGDLAGALKSYRDSLAIGPPGAIRSRQRGLAARSLGVVRQSRRRAGAQGDLAGALNSYRDSLAIIDRLAKSDPGNAGWRRHLSVSYNKIGDVQVAQGDLAGALASYR